MNPLEGSVDKRIETKIESTKECSERVNTGGQDCQTTNTGSQSKRSGVKRSHCTGNKWSILGSFHLWIERHFQVVIPCSCRTGCECSSNQCRSEKIVVDCSSGSHVESAQCCQHHQAYKNNNNKNSKLEAKFTKTNLLVLFWTTWNNGPTCWPPSSVEYLSTHPDCSSSSKDFS